MTTIDIRHRQLHVAVLEAPQSGLADHTVFFIHGSMASLEQWRFQAKAANSLYRVVSYDYFGCGKSPRPEGSFEYSTEEHTLDLIELFDKTKTKYNVLVGHSFGTSQVMRLAKARGADISGCVLVAPAVFNDYGHPIFMLPEFVLRWIQPALSKNFMALALHPETIAMKTDAHRELMALVEARANTNSMHVAKSFYRQIKFAKEDVVAKVDGRIPVMIICGSDDKLTPSSMAEQFIKWLNMRDNQREDSRVTLEIVGPASHQVMEEQPEEVNELLMDFLEKAFFGVRVKSDGTAALANL